MGRVLVLAMLAAMVASPAAAQSSRAHVVLTGAVEGTIVGDVVTIPAGDVVYTNEPLTIRARRALIVAGSVESRTGAPIRLLSDGVVVIDGQVRVSPSAEVRQIVATADRGVAKTIGAAGAHGGDITVAALSVQVGTGALVKAGDGGAGATVRLEHVAGRVNELHAVGGKGGTGGSVNVDSAAPVLLGRLLPGAGGPGGDAVADASEVVAAGADGVNATAVAGDAGSAGSVVESGSAVSGAELVPGAAGGAAKAIAGSAPQIEGLAAAGFACGAPGATGASENDWRASGSGQSASANGSMGGFGGSCGTPGGNGGDGGFGGSADAIGGDGANGCPGGDGGNADASAGAGGWATSGMIGSYGTAGTPGTVLTDGTNGTDGGAGGDGGRGGDAGSARAIAGHGGQGFLCFGGDGGWALAEGDNGGNGARGGDGGPGGDAGCGYRNTSPGSGGAGGAGGGRGLKAQQVSAYRGLGGGSATNQGSNGQAYVYKENYDDGAPGDTGDAGDNGNGCGGGGGSSGPLLAGRTCDFTSTKDLTREAGWKIGQINAGPLVTGENGTLVCTIITNSDSHSSTNIRAQHSVAAVNGVVVMEPRELHYQATAADDIALCTKWIGASGTWYWTVSDTFGLNLGSWSQNSAGSCGVPPRIEPNDPTCSTWKAIDRRLGTNIAEIWQDCEPYEEFPLPI